MRLTRKAWSCALALLLLSGQVFPLVAQERGVGRVKLENEQGRQEEVKLYDGSYALVIGASDYTNGWPKLPGVKKDVPAVKAALERQGFTVETLLNPTRQQLDERLTLFVRNYGYKAGNRLLIYFAGHGHTGKSADGRELGYIVPVDAPTPKRDDEAFQQTAMSMDDIEGYARRIQAKHALFVFDSCFSGTLLSKSRSLPPPAITYKAAQPVRQFITAGGDDQEVPDVSIFRQQFVEGLSGAADANPKDGYVTGSELAEYLQTSVTNYTKEAQTPQYGKIRDGRLDKGDFVFILPQTNAPRDDRPEPVITRRDAAAIEKEAWVLIRNSNDARDFRDFLAAYPGGANAGSAKIKLEQLAWEEARNNGGKAALEGYLKEFPTGDNAGTAQLLLKRLERANQPVPVAPPANTNLPVRQQSNQYGIEFVAISAGTFTMGSPAGETGREDDEVQHRVTIGKPFGLGKYEVTQEQWQAVMGNNPSKFKDCGKCPVEQVSWEDAQQFIVKLNGLNDGYKYRLPSEAEWEYAARAGTTGEYAGVLDNLAWYNGNAGGKTHPVGEKQANAWGLYDMHGNVWEWVQDWYGDYAKGAVTDPTGPGSGSVRVLRGGGWLNFAAYSRSAYRVSDAPGDRSLYLGFRLARTPS